MQVMGSIPHELRLDLTPAYVPRSITDFLKEAGSIADASRKAEKLTDFITRLDDEMRKIEVFKRELPLCMILLKDAIQFLKEESVHGCPVPNVQPVLEEFIPMKKDCQDDVISKERDCIKEKMNWMSSVQLWKSDGYRSSQNDSAVDNKQRNWEENYPPTDDLSQSCGTKTGGRAFMPFKGYSSLPATKVVAARKEDKEDLPVSGLSLLTPGTKPLREESGSNGCSSKHGCSRSVASSPPSSRSNALAVAHPVASQQTGRKQRRCWSPELHRRFVSALQQLGGSQVATPKQIRELMQVDGLTNDEVKSHLQKYRLHTRRVPANASTTPVNQSVVVLGGLWMSHDQYEDSSKASSSQSGSPQGPLQLTGNTGGTSTTGDDSMEGEDDEKSESYSWKSRTQTHEKDDV